MSGAHRLVSADVQCDDAVDNHPSGTIVGQYRDALGVTHGFVLDADGYRTVDVDGYPTTVLTGINAEGSIVGRARGADGFDVSFVIAK